MRTLLSLLLLTLPLRAAAQEGAGSGAIDDLLKNIPTIETKKAEADVAAEQQKAIEDARMSFDAYVQSVQAAVLAQWEPKKKLVKATPALEAQLSVKLGPDGSILDVGAVVLSGNKKWDQSALDAINAASPLPAPPDTLQGEAARGIVVRFNPSTAAR